MQFLRAVKDRKSLGLGKKKEDKKKRKEKVSNKTKRKSSCKIEKTLLF
jgi:hypothetical protein